MAFATSEMSREKPGLFWSKVWYFTTFSTSGLLFPLLNIFFRSKGLSESQIGIIAALRPWSSALSGNVWSLIGDSTGRYKTILFTAHVCAVICRYCIGLADSFAVTLVFVVLTETMTAPLQILADASSMAAGTSLLQHYGVTAISESVTMHKRCFRKGSLQEGEYGKARLWGAVGWGLCSPLSGVITSKLGSAASFDANLIGGVLALLPTVLLPTQALEAKKLGKSQLQHDGGGLAHANGEEEAITDVETVPANEREKQEAEWRAAPESDDNAFEPGGAAEDGTAPHHCGQDTSAGLMPCRHSRHSHGKIMPRGDSLLFEVAEAIPLAPAPELIDYDSLVHLHRRDSGPSDNQPGTADQDSPEGSGETSPANQGGRRASNESGRSHTLRQKVLLLFTSPDICIFFTMATLFGFAAGVIDGFLFLYLEELGGPKVLCGLTITVACVVELPVFHYMGPILRFVGVQDMLHWAMFFFLVRLGCYTLLGFLPSPWMVLPVETLNGITFGAAWAAGTVHCSRIAPLGLEATTQSIYTGLYAGLGLGGGGLFGGFVYANFGPRTTFLSAFVVLAIGWALIACAQLIVNRLRARKSSSLSEPLLN